MKSGKVKLQRFVIAFDSHGDMIVPEAKRVFLDFVKDFKPSIKIHGGDAFDFRCLRQNVSDDEANESLTDDVRHGMDFMTEFDPHVWLFGNHDHRLIRKMESDRKGVIRQFCRQQFDQIVDSLPRTQIVPYGKREGVYKLGDYRVIHGYNANLHAAYKAASHFGNVIMGHVHCTTGPVPFPHYDQHVGHSSGSLCRLDMEYNKGHLNTLKQNNGFVYGWIDEQGHTIVFHATSVGGRWYFPTEYAR